jgi:hypothetical protein
MLPLEVYCDHCLQITHFIQQINFHQCEGAHGKLACIDQRALFYIYIYIYIYIYDHPDSEAFLANLRTIRGGLHYGP